MYGIWCGCLTHTYYLLHINMCNNNLLHYCSMRNISLTKNIINWITLIITCFRCLTTVRFFTTDNYLVKTEGVKIRIELFTFHSNILYVILTLSKIFVSTLKQIFSIASCRGLFRCRLQGTCMVVWLHRT